MLTTDQIKAFQTKGYLAVDNVISQQELKELRTVTEEFVERSREIEESDDTFDLEPGHSAKSPRLRRIIRPVSKHPIYEKYVHHKSILDIVENLIGPNLRYHNNKINMKNPGHGSAVEWHQDWAFYPHTNDDVLAVGVMLDDINLSNGPLMVIPETHKGPVLSHNNSDGIFCGAIDPKDKDFNLNDAIPLTGKAGSISIHHARLLHGSATNKSSSRRMMLFYELSSADSWPLVGAPSYMKFTSPNDLWKQMKSQLISGKISTCPRMENIPVRIPLPPPSDHGSIFKIQKTGNSKSAFI